MTGKDEKSLIGFDPLAWMGDDKEAEAVEIKPEAEMDVKQVEQNAEPVVESTVDSDEVVEVVDTAPVGGNMTESNKDASKLTLDVTLNIQNVTQLYDQLLKLLESQDKIEIDASAVASIDTATLQLLIVFKQTAINLQKDVVFDFPSDKFIESAQLLGLAEMLEVDQAAAGFF